MLSLGGEAAQEDSIVLGGGFAGESLIAGQANFKV